MATFEETIEKAVQAAVKRANAYTDTKVGALPRIPHVYATTMRAHRREYRRNGRNVKR